LEYYEAVSKRRMVRDFKSQPVDLKTVKKILSAGLKAPTNDHMRNWEFVVLTDGALIEKVIKKIPKKVSDKRVNFILKSWRLKDDCQQKMYRDAIPKQYAMLSKSNCLILPLFKQGKNLLEPKSISSLNAFASIWCCIESILLAAAAEGLGCALRIPLNGETEYVRQVLRLPEDYVFPCYLAIGHPEDEAVLPKQINRDLESKLHLNAW